MWWCGWAECFDCGYRWVAIIEGDDSPDFLECPNCGLMQGRIVKGIDKPTARELLHWDAKERDDYMRATAAHAVKHGYPDNEEG